MTVEFQVKGDQNELVFGFWSFEFLMVSVFSPSANARAEQSSTQELDNRVSARMIQEAVLSVVGSQLQGRIQLLFSSKWSANHRSPALIESSLPPRDEQSEFDKVEERE